MFQLKRIFCAPEGIDTSTFFGDQNAPSEAELPDAGSPEALAMQPPVKDASDGKEPDADGADAEDPSTQEPKHVPLGALQEERTRRKQVEDRSRELETQNNALMERMTKILELQQQAQQPQQQRQEEEIPDFIDDPVGHLAAKERLWQQRFDQLAAQAQGVSQHQQQQAQYQQMAAIANAQEQAFREATPDYDAAVAHFRDVKMAEYAAFGLTPELCRAQLERDAIGLIQGSLANNRNPAEVLYGLAKALRYTPATADQQQPQQQQQQPKTPPTSLSNVPAAGRAPDEKGKLTAKDIASMPQEDFDKLFESMRDNATRPAF